MLDLFSGIEVNPCLPTATFNTGSMWDLMTGNAVEGMDGKWYIMGGMSNMIMSLQGKGSTYKSTLAASLIMRTMGIYQGVQMILDDTENAISRDMIRVCRMAGEFTKEDLIKRILVVPGASNDINSLFEIVKKLCATKEANRKDFIIETPILDVTTLKATVAWMPTFVFLDSLSEAFSDDEAVLLEEGGFDDKKSKTAYMIDGNKKTLLLRTMRRYCEQYGICFVCTAHVGEMISMDGKPVSKELQFQKQGEKTKNVGSKFKFLTGILAQTATPKIQQDAEYRALYPSVTGSPGMEINEVVATIQRCKNNMGGYSFPFIISQTDGLLNTVSNFHYLKENGYYGFVSDNKMKQQSVWLPEITLSRNTIRQQISDNYQLRRALEISAYYLYIKKNWATNTMPFDFSRTPKELYDKLNQTPGMIERILNSRSHWVYNAECADAEKEYLSIFDIVTLAQNAEAYPVAVKKVKSIPTLALVEASKKKAGKQAA